MDGWIERLMDGLELSVLPKSRASNLFTSIFYKFN